MKYGMNLLLWTGEVMEEHLPILESAQGDGLRWRGNTNF